MSIFGARMGTWIVHSESDPRWNKSGRSVGLVSSGGTEEMKEWIRECTKKYGKPPHDATMEFWKD